MSIATTARGKLRSALVAGFATFMGAGVARAEAPIPPGESPPVGSTYTLSSTEMPPAAEKPRTLERWYGTPTLIADGAAVAAFAGFLATFKIDLCIGLSDGPSQCRHRDNTAPLLLFSGSILSYGLGGPINHAAHGHWDKAGLSFGMRAAPILLAIPVSAVDSEGPATMLVAMGGIVAAMIVDAGVLSNDTVVVDSTEPKFALVPRFDPKTRTGSLSLGATF